MDTGSLFAELDRLIDGAPPGDRPSLVVALAARLAQLGAGLAAPPSTGNGRPTEEAERWLSPQQAAAIAGVPVKRLYEWARGKRWASRPTKRCLRIHEPGFRAWLANR